MRLTVQQPILAATGLALIFTGAAQAGVVAHYTFDTDFTDSSVSGNDLSNATGSSVSITSAAGEVAFGSGAADFTYPNDWLQATSTLSFGASDPWSVSFWGKKRAGADVRSGMVLGDDDSNDFIWTPDNPNVVRGIRFRNTSGTSTDYDGLNDDAQYHHWVLVADGAGNITVYRDNVNLGTQGTTTTFRFNSVGSGLATTTNNYDGQIDELYIFDEAIDPTVVNSLFTSNVVPEPASLAVLGLGGLMLVRRRRA